MLLASIICWLVYLLVAFLDWVAEREKGGGVSAMVCGM